MTTRTPSLDDTAERHSCNPGNMRISSLRSNMPLPESKIVDQPFSIPAQFKKKKRSESNALAFSGMCPKCQQWKMNPKQLKCVVCVCNTNESASSSHFAWIHWRCNDISRKRSTSQTHLPRGSPQCLFALELCTWNSWNSMDPKIGGNRVPCCICGGKSRKSVKKIKSLRVTFCSLYSCLSCFSSGSFLGNFCIPSFENGTNLCPA